MICSFNFLIFLAVCLNISTVINIKILTNSNQQTQSYKFTSHIAAFLSGFDHRDAWNLYTNIIWSKRSTDFKELSPCSVWFHLKPLLRQSWDMHSLSIIILPCKTQQRQELFFPGTISEWNQIPQPIVMTHSLKTFKAAVKYNVLIHETSFNLLQLWCATLK